MAIELKWMTEAKRLLGTHEIKDKSKIQGWAKVVGPTWYAKDMDPTKSEGTGPWCGLFAAWCMRTARLNTPVQFYRASAWESWGYQLTSPMVGCIVTFTRQGGGHVGFVIGQSSDGSLLVLGGNQENQVSVARFSLNKATSFRWPQDASAPEGGLPVVATTANFSKSQA